LNGTPSRTAFDIPDKGPVIDPPLKTKADIDAVISGDIDFEKTTPFVRQTLQDLRAEVGNEATVLGFVGAPYTLATYCVEGGSSKSYTAIKRMMFTEPELLHALLAKLADNIAAYCIFQIESGAQVVQMFDSWAGVLTPAGASCTKLCFSFFSGSLHSKMYTNVFLALYDHTFISRQTTTFLPPPTRRSSLGRSRPPTPRRPSSFTFRKEGFC
jgi:uroporphyrinogen-III decarboxylase